MINKIGRPRSGSPICLITSNGDDKKNNVHDISEDFYDDRNLVDDDDYVDDTNHAKLACEQALHLGKSREVTRE